LFPYELTPIEHFRLAPILVTNWGRPDTKTADGRRFWLCPDCGRHRPHDPTDARAMEWDQYHARFCGGRPERMVLAYRFETDAMVLTLPSRSDLDRHGGAELSPALVTVAEALLAGAGAVLELGPGEIQAFPRHAPQGKREDQIVFYETVPGGAGYLEEIARRLPDVAVAARRRLYGHECSKACYLCLKHYGNQRWHPFFDKECVSDLLWHMAQGETVEPQITSIGAGADVLRRMLERPASAETAPGVGGAEPRYRRGAIEEPLAAELAAIGDLPAGQREFEYRRDGAVFTVPDFAWPEAKLAVYCDSFAFHADQEALVRDAEKRNTMQREGWTVLTYWGRTLLRRPRECAREIAEVYRRRLASFHRSAQSLSGSKPG
jgi:hypothetical protein